MCDREVLQTIASIHQEVQRIHERYAMLKSSIHQGESTFYCISTHLIMNLPSEKAETPNAAIQYQTEE